ncbi:GNAT family N-acetyltransferase [Kitasatospora sp. NPDC050543]|uniref:GNAT family N-acetyltransferase n=1 Tax=Kitasatospora sp. NPDC050543 TaxID=3364054 RepID=UPI0037A2D79F
MQLRPITEADLASVLACPTADPVTTISAERYREEQAKGQFRPEWSWIAQDGDEVLGRALWWGRADSAQPVALDCLWIHPAVADRSAVAADLLAVGHSAFAAAGEFRLPEYNLTLPNGWRAEPELAEAVAWRREAAGRAGLTVEIERLRYEWTPEAGVPAAGGRLVFTAEPDDAVFLEVFRRLAEGTLDNETRKNVGLMGLEAAARDDMDFYLGCPGKREWWRLVHTVDGQLAGLAIPSATPYGPNVGYLGVVPELRGRRHIDEILAAITRFHAEAGAQRITATTDTDNAPMSAAFERGGYRNTEIRLVLEAPSH